MLTLMSNTFSLQQRRLFSTPNTFYRAMPSQAHMDMNYLDQVLKLNKEDNIVPYVYDFDNESPLGEMDLKGRNSKTPKKSNHGARPCSSVMRKLKKTGWFKKITAYK